jgi:pimeloyl-ACP methyl ester carboxylesterase
MRGGSGPVLLLLHGSSGAGAWLPFMDRLAKNFDVVVPEHPGFGTSDAPEWLDNIHDLAYFYLDFLEELDLRNVHLVGLSLGGWVAAEMAVRCTNRLTSLTLVGSPGIHVKGVPQVDTFLRTDEQRPYDLYFSKSLAKEIASREVTPEAENIILKNRMTTARLSWQPRSYDPHLRKWLHRIKIPTLLVWGEGDVLFPPQYAWEFKSLIPGSDVVIIPECGHVPNMEKPAEFTAALEKFVAPLEAVQ